MAIVYGENVSVANDDTFALDDNPAEFFVLEDGDCVDTAVVGDSNASDEFGGVEDVRRAGDDNRSS